MLAGKIVLVTGAARGIGAETARALARRGARPALLDVDAEGLGLVADEVEAWSRAVDVTDAADLREAVDELVSDLRGLDAVVANAATIAIGPVADLDPVAFERVIQVNLLGVYRTVRETLPHLLDSRGYLLVVDSGSALVQGPYNSAYNAAKAGIHALANSLRQEVATSGVDVGVTYFNAIDTEAGRDAINHPLMAPLGTGRMKPRPVAEAAESIVRAIERRARTVFVPRRARMMYAVPGVAQRLVDAWVIRRLGGRPEIP